MEGWRQGGNVWRFAGPLSLPSNELFLEARKRMDALVYRHIVQRRQSDPSGDLPSVLFDVRDADSGERMTDRQICDEGTALFIAGHDTTANALTWLLGIMGRR